MNAGVSRDGAGRMNRRRSPARVIGAALGRLIAFPPDPDRTREPMPTAFASSWPRFAVA
jgi:hypothetical protein